MKRQNTFSGNSDTAYSSDFNRRFSPIFQSANKHWQKIMNCIGADGLWMWES